MRFSSLFFTFQAHFYIYDSFELRDTRERGIKNAKIWIEIEFKMSKIQKIRACELFMRIFQHFLVSWFNPSNSYYRTLYVVGPKNNNYHEKSKSPDILQFIF